MSPFAERMIRDLRKAYFNPRSKAVSAFVAKLGEARQIIQSSGCKEDDVLVAAAILLADAEDFYHDIKGEE